MEEQDGMYETGRDSMDGIGWDAWKMTGWIRWGGGCNRVGWVKQSGMDGIGLDL